MSRSAALVLLRLGTPDIAPGDGWAVAGIAARGTFGTMAVVTLLYNIVMLVIDVAAVMLLFANIVDSWRGSL